MSSPKTPSLIVSEDLGEATALNVDPALVAGDAILDSETISILEEAAQVSKRQVAVGTVRVSTRTETHDEVAEVVLDRHEVDVTRVPVGTIVEIAPGVRTEGDTTIVPVIEERFVVVKQLYLKEELHIRHRVDQEVVQVPVQLRRQTAVVERIDPDGRVVPQDPSRSL